MDQGALARLEITRHQRLAHVGRSRPLALWWVGGRFSVADMTRQHHDADDDSLIRAIRLSLSNAGRSWSRT